MDGLLILDKVISICFDGCTGLIVSAGCHRRIRHVSRILFGSYGMSLSESFGCVNQTGKAIGLVLNS